MSIYKVCEVCGDYPCHCGNEYQNKHPNYILDTINSLIKLYNQKNKDENIIATINNKPISDIVQELKSGTKITDKIMTQEEFEQLPVQWQNIITNIDSSFNYINSVVGKSYDPDEFCYPGFFLIFLLQHTCGLTHSAFMKYLIGFLLKYNNLHLGTLSVLRELRSSFMVSFSKGVIHLRTVAHSILQALDIPKTDRALFYVLTYHLKKWETDTDYKWDQYTRMLSDLFIKLYVNPDANIHSTKHLVFVPDVIYFDDLYYINSDFAEYCSNVILPETRIFVENKKFI
jgi:hypothetical protein